MTTAMIIRTLDDLVGDAMYDFLGDEAEPFGWLRCFGCGHRKDEHDGYSYGPDVAEWCEGGGTQELLDPAGEVVDIVILCRCTEFE